VGSRESGEAFGEAFELPNAQAYGESCAAIGNMMWNWRMLLALGESRFADVIERALYNGINSGMSLSGTLYCYRNPLESTGEQIRNPWYDTTCCPPNLERTFASLPGYFYSTSSDGVYVHLYDNSELDWRLENGTALKVRQKTNYPWDGVVEITVAPETPADFALYLRIPSWSDTTRVAVNGKTVSGAQSGAYLPLRRQWSAGDAARIEFEMTPQALEANAKVIEDNGRVALQRGPLVYCLEEMDQPAGVALSDVAVNAGKSRSGAFEAEFEPSLLGGVVVLRHAGAAYETSPSDNGLYFRYGVNPRKSRTVPLTFIPYYAWANRAATPMQVWTPAIKA
jgi:uncharacterized protein